MAMGTRLTSAVVVFASLGLMQALVLSVDVDVEKPGAKPLPAKRPNMPWLAGAKSKPNSKPRAKLVVKPKKAAPVPTRAPAKAKAQAKKPVLWKQEQDRKAVEDRKAVAKPNPVKLTGKQSKKPANPKPKVIVKKWATEWQEAQPNSQPVFPKAVTNVVHSLATHSQPQPSIAGAPAASMEEHWEGLPAPPPSQSAATPDAAPSQPLSPPPMPSASAPAAAFPAGGPVSSALPPPPPEVSSPLEAIEGQAAQELNAEAGSAENVADKFHMLKAKMSAELGGPARRGEMMKSAIHDFIGGARQHLASLDAHFQATLGVL